jgi:hypothetical protein
VIRKLGGHVLEIAQNDPRLEASETSVGEAVRLMRSPALEAFEHRVGPGHELVADGHERTDDDDGDHARDQGVLDGGRAARIRDQTGTRPP